MNRGTHFILAILLLLLAAISCDQRKKTAPDGGQSQKGSLVLLPDEATVYDRIPVEGEPFFLSARELSSDEAILSAFYGGNTEYYVEGTPPEKAFFFLEPDVRPGVLSRKVQLRYNYACVLNRVIHAYEVFCRLPDDIDEDKKYTKRDTLKWVRATQPVLPEGFLREVLPEEKSIVLSQRILAAYRAFDGDDSAGSPFSRAFDEYVRDYDSFLEIVSEEQVNQFEEGFWDWYDKAQYVPEIDELVKVHLRDSKLPRPDSLQVQHLRAAVMGERDINRRAILALELVQHDRREGALLLGDILESGRYTRYLLEVWLSWRANVQMEHSPSSFSVIANNYFDRMRVKCLNTFLRHCQKEQGDVNALCLMQNMILCEIVHRQGSLAGNSSFLDCMHLAYEMFIHPRLLPQEKRERN